MSLSVCEKHGGYKKETWCLQEGNIVFTEGKHSVYRIETWRLQDRNIVFTTEKHGVHKL